MIDTKKIKDNLYNIFWWGFFAFCVYGLISTSITGEWVKWKWGYYNIDHIPYVLILFFLMLVQDIHAKNKIRDRLDKLEAKI